MVLNNLIAPGIVESSSSNPENIVQDTSLRLSTDVCNSNTINHTDIANANGYSGNQSDSEISDISNHSDPPDSLVRVPKFSPTIKDKYLVLKLLLSNDLVKFICRGLIVVGCAIGIVFTGISLGTPAAAVSVPTCCAVFTSCGSAIIYTFERGALKIIKYHQDARATRDNIIDEVSTWHEMVTSHYIKKSRPSQIKKLLKKSKKLHKRYEECQVRPATPKYSRFGEKFHRRTPQEKKVRLEEKQAESIVKLYEEVRNLRKESKWMQKDLTIERPRKKCTQKEAKERQEQLLDEKKKLKELNLHLKKLSHELRSLRSLNHADTEDNNNNIEPHLRVYTDDQENAEMLLSAMSFISDNVTDLAETREAFAAALPAPTNPQI